MNFNATRSAPCIVCLKGKQTRGAFKHTGSRVSNLLDLIHSDVCGPIKTNSNGGARYFLTFVDEYSRKVFVYFFKAKSEVTNLFLEFKSFVENQTGVVTTERNTSTKIH